MNDPRPPSHQAAIRWSARILAAAGVLAGALIASHVLGFSSPSWQDRLLLLLVAAGAAASGGIAATLLIHEHAEASAARRRAAELAQANAALATSERYLENFFETAPIGLLWVAADGTILRANRAELAILGYTPDEFVGRNIAEFHTDDRFIKDLMIRLGRGDTVHECEARLRAKDGSIRHVLISSSALFENGRFVHTRCFTRDITDLRRGESSLARSEQSLRLACRAAAAGAWELDTATGIIVLTSEARDLLGLAPDEHITRNDWLRIVHPDDRARLAERVREIVDDGAEPRLEFRILRPDGALRWIQAMWVTLDSTGSRRLIGIAQDTSDRHADADALVRSERRHRALAENAPALIWTARPDGSCDYFNQRWCDHTGLTLEESLGWGWQSAIHPDDLPAALEQWQHALANGSVIQAQYRLRRADLAWRWHLARATPVRDDAGAVTAWFGSCTDIHEQKATEERLADLNAALSRSNRDLEDFAHIAAHDLREPLRGLRLCSAFLKEDLGASANPEVRRHLDSIDRLGQRMDELVNSLLHYSIVGQSDLTSAPTDLNQVVAGVLESLAPVLRERAVSVTLAENLPTIRCDPVRVSELFRNLITNAAKYSTRADRRIEIGVRTPEPGSSLPVLYVRDNGIGIAPEHHDAVFRIFRRLHARDEFGGGTGSGLAIAKRIVERHGGRIWIESALDEGSTFLFTLGKATHAPIELAHSHR